MDAGEASLGQAFRGQRDRRQRRDEVGAASDLKRGLAGALLALKLALNLDGGPIACLASR